MRTPIVVLLTQGITAEKVALSLAFGIALGVFPVLGSTTVLCLVAALVFRLNLPAIQLANYLMYPLQLGFLLPFIRAGQMLYHTKPLRMSLEQMTAMARAGRGHTIQVLWVTALQAATAWLLVGPAAIGVLYLVLTPILRRLASTSRHLVSKSPAQMAPGSQP